MRAPALLCAAACMLGAHPAAANPVKSLYTTVELKSCKPVKRAKAGEGWHCEGLPGYPVYVAEGDLRQFVSTGKDAEHRKTNHREKFVGDAQIAEHGEPCSSKMLQA